MKLLRQIEEHINLAWSGKINILKSENGQYVGAIFITDGAVVGTNYLHGHGEKALLQVLYDSLESDNKFYFIYLGKGIFNHQ